MPIKDAMAPPSKFRSDKVQVSQRGRGAVDDGAIQPRPRSLSGSRNPVRSNDLVQSVYDRLGVARGNTWSKTPSSRVAIEDLDPILGSAPTQEENNNSSSSIGGNGNGRMNYERTPSFHDRQKNFVQQSQPSRRGRSDEPTLRDEDRPRSLSRGRVADRYPPARNEAAGTESNNASVSAMSKKPSWRGLNGTNAHSINTSAAHRSIKTVSPTRLSPTHPSSTRLNPAKSPKQVSSSIMIPSLEADDNTAKLGAEETETAANVGSKEAFSSVRERMRRYSGGGPKTTGSRFLRRDSKQYGANVSERQFPSKVNIYSSGKEHIDISMGENNLDIADEKKDDDAGVDFEGAGATKFSSALSRASTHAKSHHYITGTDSSVGNSRFKAANRVSNSYLSSLQPSPKPQSKSSTFHAQNGAAPVTEISTQLQETGIDNDANSIAMSSVSQDDLQQPTTPSTKRTMWQNDRNRVKAIAPVPAAVDAALVNKMIDDRVQAHIADMETRLGAQMRRFMQQMDDKILERLEKMENKLRNLQEAVEAKRSLGRLGQPVSRF